MGREPKDKEEDSGIDISYTESNDLEVEDMKSTENKETSVTNHDEKDGKEVIYKEKITHRNTNGTAVDKI